MIKVKAMFMPLGYGYPMMGSMMCANVPEYFKNRYGDGYSDFGTTPYAQPYPMAIVPRRLETPPPPKSWIGKIIDKCY